MHKRGQADPTICVVVPVHDEAAHLDRLLPALKANQCAKVLVVDDGSTDSSRDICRSWGVEAISNSMGAGRDGALRCGLEFSRQLPSFRWFVMLDGDSQHDPGFLSHLLDLAPSADLVKGSRFLPESQQFSVPVDRRLLARLLQFIVLQATSHDVSDLNCGLIALSRAQLDWALAKCKFDQHVGVEIVMRLALSQSFRGQIIERPITATFSIRTNRDYQKYFLTSPRERFFSRARSILEKVNELPGSERLHLCERSKAIIDAIMHERHESILELLARDAYDN